MQDSELKIIDAIKKGDPDLVRQLLTEQPDLIQTRTSQGISLLMLSLYYLHPKIADLLIQNGIQMNVFDAAAAGNLVELANLVNQEDSIVNAFSSDGFQPIGLASFFGRTQAVEYLVQHHAEVNSPSHNSQQVTPLHSAAAANNIEISRILINQGADVNLPQHDGFTPLHAAAQNGNLEMVKVFISRGADLNALTKDGKTPLNLAIEQNHHTVSNYLQSLGV